MTFSLTVVLCEISNDAGSLLPLMVAVFAARFVGDAFNVSLFDASMTFAGYPFLEVEAERKFSKLTAEDVMTSNVVTLSEVETAARIVEVLQTTTHHAFPIVDAGESGSRRYLVGYVVRYQLEVLLRKRAFLPLETAESEEARRLLSLVVDRNRDEGDMYDDDGTPTPHRVLLARPVKPILYLQRLRTRGLARRSHAQQLKKRREPALLAPIP